MNRLRYPPNPKTKVTHNYVFVLLQKWEGKTSVGYLNLVDKFAFINNLIIFITDIKWSWYAI